MTTYDWPGNVRELENAMQRAVVLAENGVISISDIVVNPMLCEMHSEMVIVVQVGEKQMQVMV